MPKKDITAQQRTRRWHDGLAAVNAAAAANKIPGILAVHGKKLDLDMVAYGGLRDTSAVDAAVFAVINGGDDYETRDALALVFEPILRLRAAAEHAVDAVNSVEAADKLGALSVYAPMLGIDLTDYNRLSDEGRDNVHDTVFGGIPFADDAAIKVAVDAAVATELESEAVAAVNAAADANAMSAALFAYADALAIEVDAESDYAALTAEKQALVLAAMITDRPAGGYADAAAIMAAFDAAVLAQA